MLDLSRTVTLICRTTRDHETTKRALELCLSRAKFYNVVIISDDPRRVAPDGIEYVGIKVKKIKVAGAGCVWAMTEWPSILESLDTASHLLGIEYDGYLTNSTAWHDDFLKYDYLGTPWGDGVNGNGGFTIVSRKFWKHVGELNVAPRVEDCSQSDVLLCRYASNGRLNYRGRMEEMGATYAPPEVAARFSTGEMYSGQFGFHGKVVIPQIASYGLDQVGGEWDYSRSMRIIEQDTEIRDLNPTGTDNVVQYDGLYAKYVFQKFMHANSAGVLRRLIGAVKPGGYLCISAPDLDFIARVYTSGKMTDNPNTYLFGPQTDTSDCYYSVYNGQSLVDGLTLLDMEDAQSFQGPFGPAHSPTALLAIAKKPQEGKKS